MSRRATVVSAVAVVVSATPILVVLSGTLGAYRRIKHAGEFSSLFVGMPPAISDRALDFNVLANLPWTSGLYRKLVSEGSPAGQLYGLCGLYVRDEPAFRELKHTYAVRGETVRQTIGCISVRGPLRAVVYPEGTVSFEESCRPLKLTFGDWLRAMSGSLQPR